MDARTANLLEALDPIAVELLTTLLASPATETDLVKSISGATQPTIHRRLTRLAKAGLVAHEPGMARAPGRLWSLLHTQEIERLVTTLLALSDAIEDRDRAERDQTRRHLKRARADRLGFEDTSRRSA
jgi:DNA-binding HxlR family transcriptional regulator